DDLARGLEHHALDGAAFLEDVAVVVDHGEPRAAAVAGVDGDALVGHTLHDGVLQGVGGCGGGHAASRSRSSCFPHAPMSGTFASTSAAAMGGLTLLPHMRTWARLGRRLPSITGAN